MSSLLIVANTPTENTQALLQAVSDGAHSLADNDLQITVKPPLATMSEDVLRCDAIIIGTTEHFGAMSGQIKDFFERIYYPCLTQKQGLATAIYIKASLDGSGTQIGVEKILAGLRWRMVQKTLLLHGQFTDDFSTQCRALGQTMAAGLQAGIF